jgi:kynurenine 3-monooxygenase
MLQDSRAKALQQYTRERSQDAKALVESSHRADQGFIFFVLPVIMDRFFKKLFPWMFEVSLFTLMARSGRLSHMLWRKRWDRFVQCMIIGSVVAIALNLLYRAVIAAGRMVLGMA